MRKRENNSHRASTRGLHLARLKNTLQIPPYEEEEILRVCPSPVFTERSLPLPLTPLIGRERELETICSLLQYSSVRLVTLTGPGGAGKTRLALQIATEVESLFTDGVFFISLTSVKTFDQALPTLARVLGLRRDQGTFAHIQAVLRDQRCLLLFDNFEHIADAAPQLKKLLAVSPFLKILVTSRTVLRLLEEQVFDVPPLALPDLAPLPPCEDLAQVAAVSLFLQRASTAHPGFELTNENALAVAQICICLDGLPLALELAAERIKLFPPHGLLEKLEQRLSFLTGGPLDAPERHQTLRKAIEWSYNALSQEEQRLFRHLSVFVGGCSLSAIEAVCNVTSKQGESLFDILASLLNQSLLYRKSQINQRDYHFTMLETIREYAFECFQSSDEQETISQAHAEYYLALTKTMELKAAGGEAPQWIKSDFENVRSAFHWFLSSPDRERTLRMKIIEIGSPLSLAACLLVMGTILALQKRYTWAVRLWGKAKALCRTKDELSELEPHAWLHTLLGTNLLYAQMLETISAQLGDQAFMTAWNEGRSMAPEQLLARARPPMMCASYSPSDKGTIPYFHKLTPREKEVLRLLTQGLSSALIAETLFVSLTTVNSHVRTIYNKLGVSSRSAATRYALEHHLV